jgi:hypothetical protein
MGIDSKWFHQTNTYGLGSLWAEELQLNTQTTMLQKRRESRWAIFVIGVVLINFPFLSVFNKNQLVFGLPMTYFFLFTLWISIIVFTYIMTLKQK